jgi:hypothetical protein
LDPKWQKVLPHYAQDTSLDESEDETDDDRYESHAPKACGLFPRFCLLSPLQGLRVEDKIVNSAIHGVQGKSIVSHRKNAKEVFTIPNFFCFCYYFTLGSNILLLFFSRAACQNC